MFIDNIKIIRVKRLGHIEKVKQKLVTVFEIIDMGLISFYLGLKIERNYQNKILKFSSLCISRKSLLNTISIKSNFAIPP